MGVLTPEVMRFVNTVKLGFVATVCPDGTPNLSPKGTTMAWDENSLAFADIYSPVTTKNIFTNPAIEINVVDIFLRKGYRFKGSAQVLRSGDVLDAIRDFFQNLGSKYRIHHIILVKVDHVLPIVSPAYDHMSQEEILNRWIDYWTSIHAVGKKE
jgi:predicted pyridoxine 5'-phosphate oxidase superfamily flavin-nucleotide-binding protein